MLWKEGSQKKKLYFEFFLNDATWRFEILDCILHL